MSLSIEELQEVFDEMRLGKVVMYMHDQPVKKEDASIEEQQNDLKESVLKDLDKKCVGVG